MAKRTCTVEGCERPYYGNGGCRPHFDRKRRTGSFGTSPISEPTPVGAALKFLRQTVTNPPTNECAIWPFGKNTDGYGAVLIDGELTRAHRAALMMHAGPAPTPQHDAAHKPVTCHNRACINPLHLEWKTRAENLADRILDDTDHRGEKHPQAILTNQQADEIRADRRTQQVIADDYGIARTTVSAIKNGYIRAH